MSRIFLLGLVIFAGIVSGCAPDHNHRAGAVIAGDMPAPPGPDGLRPTLADTAALEALPVLDRDALTYLGVFAVPPKDRAGNSLACSGHALTHNPASDRVYMTEAYGESRAVHVFQIPIPAG